jgi:hypothetical protein
VSVQVRREEEVPMVRWFAVAAAALSLYGAYPARAVIRANDVVPAATLLYPYFEVDLSNENGVTTLLTLQSATASATLNRWTLWTDLGVPTIAFDTYLTGFDTLTFNLRDLFVGGNIPRTASSGQDPQNTISPKGDLSQDINFASCSAANALDPLPPNIPFLAGDPLADLQAAHRGLAAPTYFGSGNCGGVPHGDQIVRGYVTIDAVNQCMAILNGFTHPGAGSYFNGVVATSQNVLVGDYVLVDPARNRLDSDVAVHIEADPMAFGGGQYTFYGGLSTVDGSAIDYREPLATAWAASYQRGDSELIVWRDTGRDTAAFSCGSLPAYYPMQQEQIIGFDMESTGTPVSGVTPFPYRTQIVPVGPASGLELPAPRGWAFLNLNTFVPGNRFGLMKQTWVTVRRRLEPGDGMTGAWSAIPLGHPSNFDNPILVPNP